MPPGTHTIFGWGGSPGGNDTDGASSERTGSSWVVSGGSVDCSWFLLNEELSCANRFSSIAVFPPSPRRLSPCLWGREQGAKVQLRHSRLRIENPFLQQFRSGNYAFPPMRSEGTAGYHFLDSRRGGMPVRIGTNREASRMRRFSIMLGVGLLLIGTASFGQTSRQASERFF